MKCPLCESENSKIVEKIKKNDLVKLNKKLTGIDFGYLIYENICYCECQKCKLRYYDPLITGDEKFYNSLQKFDWYYQDEKEEFVVAKDYIKESDKVIEVGSGKGSFVKFIPTKDYIGLDVSKNAKKMAAQNGVTIKNEMIQDYAKKHQEEYDVAVSFQVLEHVSDPKIFIESKLKVLVKGGLMILAVPSEDSFMKYVINGVLNMPPHHVTRWNDETFKFIAKKYNLRIISIIHEKVQPYHKEWYINTFFQTLFMSKETLINLNFLHMLKTKIISLVVKIFIDKLPYEMLPTGMTVIAVFKKI